MVMISAGSSAKDGSCSAAAAGMYMRHACAAPQAEVALLAFTIRTQAPAAQPNLC
jgi:hypothetical protein